MIHYHSFISIFYLFLNFYIIIIFENTTTVPLKNRLISEFHVPVCKMRIVNPWKVEAFLTKRLSGQSHHFQADSLPTKLRNRSNTARATDVKALKPAHVIENAKSDDLFAFKGTIKSAIFFEVLNPVIIYLLNSIIKCCKISMILTKR